MKPQDKPLWYDVYEAFPPKYEPRFDRPPVNKEIPAIFYPEDIIRAYVLSRQKRFIIYKQLWDNDKNVFYSTSTYCVVAVVWELYYTNVQYNPQ